MRTQTKETQDNLTPADARKLLVEGNKRFTGRSMVQRDLNSQVEQTSTGQFPFAVVLSCIDSRVPAEMVFDQGIGDIFSARVAGNVINEDILGSMEFACKLAGSKIVVVMGHTKCGAVHGACKRVEMGNLSILLSKIKPAMDKIGADTEYSPAYAEKVSVANVHESIKEIREKSPILAELEKNGEIEIVGAMYSVDNGEVEFY